MDYFWYLHRKMDYFKNKSSFTDLTFIFKMDFRGKIVLVK